MDDRTARILRALNPEGVDLLLLLLDAPATEQQLTDNLPCSLSTVHRRLSALADAGLVEHQEGVKYGPHRPWRVLHAAETDSLIRSLLDLADRAESASTSARNESRATLGRARAARSGLRSVADEVSLETGA